MNWPNLFIVGAAKAGTTTLHNFLGRHPAIHMSPVKEPHFFTENLAWQSDQKEAMAVQDEGNYLALFETDNDKVAFRGESSPSYLWESESALRIREVSPTSKVIVILRDPVMRAFSHYKMDYHSEREKNFSFLRALKDDINRPEKGWGKSRLYMELGYYSEAISRFQDVFGTDNVLVLYYEEFFENPSQRCQRIWDFLTLPPVEIGDPPKLNRGVSVNPLNKLLKKLPGKQLLHAGWRKRVQQSVGSVYQSSPPRDAVKFLLEAYCEDLRRLHEMGITYYTEYMRKKYSLDIVTTNHGS